jgi:hypothetical protein
MPLVGTEVVAVESDNLDGELLESDVMRKPLVTMMETVLDKNSAPQLVLEMVNMTRL